MAAKLEGVGPHVFESVTRDKAAGKLYVKLVNASSHATPMKVEVEGLAALKPAAKLTVLSGKMPEETNTIANPKAIVPVEKAVMAAAKSVNVLSRRIA